MEWPEDKLNSSLDQEYEEMRPSEASNMLVLPLKRKVQVNDDQPLGSTPSKRTKAEVEDLVEKQESLVLSKGGNEVNSSGEKTESADCALTEGGKLQGEKSSGEQERGKESHIKSDTVCDISVKDGDGDVNTKMEDKAQLPIQVEQTANNLPDSHMNGKEKVPEKEVDQTEEELANETPGRGTSNETPGRRYPTRNRTCLDKMVNDDAKTGSLKLEDEDLAVGDSNGIENGDGDQAASSRSDGGSDKENMSMDTPVDLSNAGTPDVIMLSDEEESDEQKKLTSEKLFRQRRRIRHLQSELRNEEAKLVLLKKLRQSQQAPPVPETLPSNTTTVQPVKPPVPPRQSGAPPPLARGGPGTAQVRTPHLQHPQNRNVTQASARNIQAPPPLVGAQRGNPSSSLATPNIRNMNPASSSSQRTAQQQQQTVPVPKAATPPQPPVDTQTPAQRQAAAKLALRKQLEKTLLQIPPPKPPAPEMNFIPSLACPDFVLLLGLEEVVNHIIDLQLIARGQKSADEKFICNPFTCVQCGTDYTPVWKREKPGSKNVICEHCVTWNQKRALKQEHTNRLKSAFVKALQQEQEIERMQVPTSTIATSPVQPPTPPAPSSSAPPQALAAAQAATNAAAAMSMNSASFRASAEQLRQQQNFLQQAHQAQLRAGQPLAGLQAGFGSRGTFPYSLPYVKQAELRHYLDMIPRANLPWKH